MNKIALALLMGSPLGLLALATGCNNTAPAAADAGWVATQDYLLQPNVTVATREQVEAAVVAGDQVAFPSAGNQGLLALKEGDVLVGDRTSSGAATNRYGFARKVASVETAGDQIVVHTAGDVSLEDIFQKADLRTSVSLDQLEELPLLPGQVEQGQLKQGLKFQHAFGGDFGPIKLPSVSFEKETSINGLPVKIVVEGSLELTQAKFIFAPTLDLGLKLGGFIPSQLEHFHLLFDGASDIAVLAKATLALGIGSSLKIDLNEEDRIGLAQKIADALSANSDPKQNPSFESPDLLDVEVAGPALGPVPTTIEVSINVVCTASLKASIEYEKGVASKANLRLGLAYDDPVGWSSLSSADYGVNAIGNGFTRAAGTIALSCGLQPKLSWKLAAALGPYLSMEGGGRASMTYEERCPSGLPSGLPDGRLVFKHELYVKGKGGGTVKVLGHKVADVSRELFDKKFPLFEEALDFGDQFVFGRCELPDAGTDAGVDAGVDGGSYPGADGGLDGGTGDGGPTCAPLQTACGGACTDVTNDPSHCGACGTACAVNEGCSRGKCCPSGKANCGGSCVDLAIDSANCGQCGNPCFTGPCVNGACTFSCTQGLLHCGNGCVDPRTDINHCGGCGKACTGTQPACCNGVCVDTFTDVNNCGSCGNTTFAAVCKNVLTSGNIGCCEGKCVDLNVGTASGTGSGPRTLNCGTCGTTCTAGGRPWCCNGSCADLSSKQNCSTCGTVCGATQSCVLTNATYFIYQCQ